jgi:hypothetical protein
MSMNALEYDTLNMAFAVCKIVIHDLQPRLLALQQQYDSEGGVGSTLTQQEMDEVAALSGLTKVQADDGIYALTAVMLPAITNSYASLSQMASRYRGGMPSVPTTTSIPTF